ncbi:MAG: glycosyltransferase [Actinomycetota bacterium]|nr:glycosyltransferase [Actinomycetota bacterium]
MDTERPAVDVVVPFRGTTSALAELVAGMSLLRLGEGDTLTIVDNGPGRNRYRNVKKGSDPISAVAGVRVIEARERASSYYARNRGAAAGEAGWLLFLDADVEPPPDLLDRYFGRPIGERVAVLAGGVRDEEAGDGSGAVARWAALGGLMDQRHTLEAGRRSYAQTANCAVRRSAFEEVGGFREDIRSGGDADLCFRLADAGWSLEASPEACVIHRSRRKLRKLLRQRARHGSGAAWLERRYPGTFPARGNWPGLAKWTLTSLAGAALHAARGRRDQAIRDAIDPLTIWAFELGRHIPNTVR